jgi:hypothetical protein
MFVQLQVQEIHTGIGGESSDNLPLDLYRRPTLFFMLKDEGCFEKFGPNVEMNLGSQHILYTYHMCTSENS